MANKPNKTNKPRKLAGPEVVYPDLSYHINDLFKQQLQSYLKATGLRPGILINFGSQRVEYTRIAN